MARARNSETSEIGKPSPKSGAHRDERWAHGANWRDIKVCMDMNHHHVSLLRNSKWIAEALSLPISIFQVLSPDAEETTPIDPIDWQKLCRETQARLETIAVEVVGEQRSVLATVIECPSPDKVCAVVPEAVQSLVSIFRRTGSRRQEFSEAARCFIDNPFQSLLVVPDKWIASSVDGATILAVVDASSRYLRICELASKLAITENGDVQLIRIVRGSKGQDHAGSGLQNIEGISEGMEIPASVEVRGFDVRSDRWMEALISHKPAVVLVQDGPNMAACIELLLEECPCPLLVLRSRAGSTARTVQPALSAAGIRLPDGAEG